ncbi:MAG: lysophospholipid acyltransferase family protein, partial [Calditrichota bacterium]
CDLLQQLPDHLDTLVLMSLFPISLLPIVRPVAASDYFLRNKLFSWFSLNIIGIIPLKRKRDFPEEDLLQPCYKPLENNTILIFFPEGSRGEPEAMTRFKRGIAKLAEKYPEVPVIPIFIHGAGKALPKGEAMLVPFFCDVFIGDKLKWNSDTESYLQTLNNKMAGLASEGNFPSWS